MSTDVKAEEDDFLKIDGRVHRVVRVLNRDDEPLYELDNGATIGNTDFTIEDVLLESEVEETQNASAGRVEHDFCHINPALTRLVESIQERHDRSEPIGITGISTGFKDIDSLISGLHPGELLILAGRPSMGTTSLATNIAEHVGSDEKLPVALFSMQLKESQLSSRLLCSAGLLDGRRMCEGRLNDGEWSRLTSSLDKLHDKPIYINAEPSTTPSAASKKAHRLHRVHGKLGLIVFDSLQLMTADQGQNQKTREADITQIARSLKQLARELDVPIIATSTLGSDVERRPNKRPCMSDLRATAGDVEDIADVIAFIYRDELYFPGSADTGYAEILIAKQRNGPRGMARLTFVGEYTRFENCSDPFSY